MKSIIFGLVVVSMFISGCNDSSPTEGGKGSMLVAEVDHFGGDLHQILGLDIAPLIDKYTVFSLSLMLPKQNEKGLYTRTIRLMGGLKSISEKDENAYFGSDPSERQKVAQVTFEAFAKKHGKLISPAKTTYLPSEQLGTSDIKQDVFTFADKEHGYTAQLTLQSYDDGQFYRLITFMSHRK
jgi:hypothetical protein